MGKNDVSKIVLKGNVDEYVTISDKKNVTLDLNGFILTNETDSTSAAKGVIVNNGILTIQDSSKDGNGTVNAMNRKVAVANAGTLTFESGNFKNTATTGSKPYANYILNNNGKVVINGGIFQVDSKTQTNSSVIKNGWYDPTNTGVHANDVIAYQEGKIAEMTINNGSFSSWTYVKNDTYGKMTINNGSFNVLKKDNGSSGNCVYNGGDLTVKGGTFDNSNAAKAGALFLIGSGIKNSGTVTNIDGGVFNLNAKYSGQESPSAPLILISGESGVPGGIDINIDTDAVKNLGDHPLALTALFVNKDSSGNITERYDKVGEFQLTVGGCSIADSNFGDIKTKGDNSATADYKPSFTYSNGKLVVDTISMGTGNSYVSGNVKIESLIVADNGTVVLGSGSEAKLADDSAKTKIVSTGGVLKDTTGKTIEAEKKTVDNITTVEDLNKALAIGADVENVNVTLKDREVITVSGSTLSGTIKFGSDSVNFNGVKGDFTVFGGNSVDVRGNITGGTISVTTGAVEIISGKIIADTTIEAASGATVKFSDVTVNSGVTLTLVGPGTFTVVAEKAFNLYGSIANGNTPATGATTPALINVIVPEKATFKAYSGSQIAGTILVTGPASPAKAGTIDLTQAQNPQTVGEDISYDKTYGQLENVTVVGSLTIKNNSTVTVMGGFNVNEDVTLTIEKGSKLVIDSLAASMIVDGRIVVEEGATLEVANAKDVKVSGSIESEGTVVIDSKVTIKSGGAITINDGTVGKATAAVTSVADVKKLYGSVFEPKQGLVVEAGATLTVKSLMYSDVAMNIDNKGTVIFDKAIIGGSSVTVKMLADGAVVEVLSIENIATNVDATGKATAWQSNSLVIKDLGLVFADKTKVETGKENTVTIAPQGYAFKGLTVVEKVSSSTVNGQTTYYNTLDLAGTVSLTAADGVTLSSTQNVITVTGDRVAVTGELALGKYVGFTVNGKLSVSGTLTATETKSNVTIGTNGEITVSGLVQTIAKIDSKINAAMYESKIGTTTVYNYTTLKAAIDSGAKDITVSGKIYVTESVTVPAGVTIKNNGEIVVGSAYDTEVVLTVADTASIKYGKVTVDGTLYFENKKDNKAAEIVSDVSVIGEKDARYTNLFTALNNANAGETVTVDKTTVDLKKSITIKEGVTLDVPNSKALKVYAGVTITVNGTLKTAEKIETATFTKTDGTEAQVTFDLAADKLNGKAAIIVNGVFMSGVEFSYNGDAPAYMIPGAYYSLTDDAGAYNYVTTLENASKTAATVVTVYGKVSAGDVVFTGTDSEPKTVTVAAGADLTVASITLDKASFEVKSTGRFTGDVKVGDSAVTVKNVKVEVSIDKNGHMVVETVSKNVTGTETASFKIAAGSIHIREAFMDVTVASGATLASDSEQTILNAKLTIEGTVSVANEQTITVKDDVTVKGALSVADATDSKIAGTFNAEKNLYIGLTPKDVTGDAASVSGAVSKVQVAFVKADANVSDATIESFKVDGVLKSTTYVVEGKDWMTVYDRTGNYNIGKVTEAPFENAEFKADKWLNTDGESADNKVIGAPKCDKVTANIEYKIYTIQITPCAGIESIAIDGNLIGDYNYGDYSDVKVKAGSHTVTYSLANGYSGEAKLSLVESGDKTTASVSGQTFTVSGEKGVVKLQLTGVEKSGYVDPVVPEQKDDDDGMSLTDILLIVLVVLIVIMAVIVAMRLMRS